MVVVEVVVVVEVAMVLPCSVVVDTDWLVPAVRHNLDRTGWEMIIRHHSLNSTFCVT